MGGEGASVFTGASEAEDGQQPARRIRSSIEFPYSDMKSAVDLAQTLRDRAGRTCEADELAAWMDQSATGGTFRSRLSAARMFGLVELSQGAVTLTQLGNQALDPGNTAARSKAFLNVELYRAMYEQNCTHPLPPAAALERQMVQLGVSHKQQDRARQTFVKSAQFAGFVDPSTGRFIKPGNLRVEDAEKPQPEDKVDERRGGTSGGGDEPPLHPFIQGLLRELPAAGTAWPEAKRKLWLDTASSIFKMIYKEPDAHDNADGGV